MDAERPGCIPTQSVGTRPQGKKIPRGPFTEGRGAWERDRRAKKFNCVTPVYIKLMLL
jgi:hypothetical protein